MKKDNLKKQSVMYLKKYLSNKRNIKKMESKEIQYVKQLIKRKTEKNKLLACEIIDSRLFQLAITKLTKDSKRECKDLNVSEIMLVALQIINTAQLVGKKDLLDDYCKIDRR